MGGKLNLKKNKNLKIESYLKHPQEVHISGSPVMNVLGSEEMFDELKKNLLNYRQHCLPWLCSVIWGLV